MVITVEKELKDMKKRLESILYGAKKGIFTLEDAKDFVEKISPFIEKKLECKEISSKSRLVKRYNELQEIYRKEFYWIAHNSGVLLILAILHEENEPYTEQNLQKKILESAPDIHPFSLEVGLEMLEKYGYIKRENTFLKLTKRGEIAITLVKHKYEEVYGRIIRKYHSSK